MSEGTRDVLTWVVLLVLGTSIAWFWKGANDADWVFSTMSGADWSIRNRITRGKRCLIWSAVFLFLCIQGVADLDPQLRAFLFVLGCVLMMWGSFFIWRGYRLWRRGIQLWTRE